MPKAKKIKTSVTPHRRIDTRHVPGCRPLDDLAKQLIDGMVSLLSRSPHLRQEVLAYFADRVHAVPWIGAKPNAVMGEPDDLPGEVLSRWCLLSRFCLDGQPRPLPLTGRISLTSLIRSISRRVGLEEVIQKLIDMGSMVLENGLYRLTERALRLRNDPEQHQRHAMRVVRDLLKTLESNARGQESLRTFEFISIGNVPLSEYQKFNEEQGKAALSFLQEFDRARLMVTQAYDSQVPMVRMLAAVFFADDRPLPTLSAPGSEAPQAPSR